MLHASPGSAEMQQRMIVRQRPARHRRQVPQQMPAPQFCRMEIIELSIREARMRGDGKSPFALGEVDRLAFEGNAWPTRTGHTNVATKGRPNGGTHRGDFIFRLEGFDAEVFVLRDLM